jgi:hypothetical protein
MPGGLLQQQDGSSGRKFVRWRLACPNAAYCLANGVVAAVSLALLWSAGHGAQAQTPLRPPPVQSGSGQSSRAAYYLNGYVYYSASLYVPGRGWQVGTASWRHGYGGFWSGTTFPASTV